MCEAAHSISTYRASVQDSCVVHQNFVIFFFNQNLWLNQIINFYVSVIHRYFKVIADMNQGYLIYIIYLMESVLFNQ